MQGKSRCTEAQNLQPCPAELVLLLTHQCSIRIHCYGSKLKRELDLQGCRIILVNILLSRLHPVLITH